MQPDCAHCGKKFIKNPTRRKRFCSHKCALDSGVAHRSHGMVGTPIYRVWKAMKSRCLNKNNAAYIRYGGRGVLLDRRWSLFEAFFSDMRESYEKHVFLHGLRKTQLERIDNNGPYSKENCTWVTPKIQSSNRRSNIKITLHGQTKILKEWSQEFGIPYRLAWKRIRVLKWDVERALSK